MVFVTKVLSGAFVVLGKRFKFLSSDGATATPVRMKDIRYQMNSQTKRGSVVPRGRWWRQCVVAGTTVVMVAVGGSAALAQPASTTPTPSPAPVTTTAPATSDVVPAPALTEDTADPCAVPTTATVTTTTTAPAPPCDPATTPVAPEPVGPETAAASESAPAPEQPPVAPAQDTVAPPAETVAPLPAELMPAAPAADQPIAPDDPELSSKTAEPDLDWRPTENPRSTIVPGQMRSDREEIPAPFTKEDADKAEMLEAQQRSTSGTSRMSLLATCQTYWPSPYSVCGDIRDKYNSLGGPASFLSFPTSGNIVNPGNTGERVTFLNGPIYWSAAGGAHPVVNSFLNRWGIHSYEAGWLKYPTTDEIVLPDGGRRQEFQDGAIYVAFQNAVGSAIRNGPLRDKYNSIGGLAPGGTLLGYPIQDQVGLPDGQGQMDRFQNGVIYWHPTHGAWPVTEPLLTQWASSGYEQGSFGYPTGDFSVDAGIAVRQQFQRDTIHTPGTKIPIGSTGLFLTYGIPATTALGVATLPNGLIYNGPGYNLSLRITPSATLMNSELTIVNNQAPQQFRMVFGLPPGYSLSNVGNSVTVNGPGGVVADIGNPFAAGSDQQGVSVQTSVQGNQVVYTIVPGTAFPITAVNNVASDVSESYNPYYRIGGVTAALCAAEDFDCARSIRAYFDSQTQSEAHYPERVRSDGSYLYDDDRLDADRHCMWMGMTTEASNAAFAKRLGDAHEQDKPSGAESAIMDNFNNITGRAVGLRNEGDVEGIIIECNGYADAAPITPIADVPTVGQSNPGENSLLVFGGP